MSGRIQYARDSYKKRYRVGYAGVRRTRRRRGYANRRVKLSKSLISTARPYLYKRTTSNFTQVGTDTFSSNITVSALNAGLIRVDLNGTGPTYKFFWGQSIGFSLADIPNYSEFTQLYDQYKINKIVLKIYPFNNIPSTANTTATSGGVGLIIHSILDPDNLLVASADEAGVNTLRQYQNYKTVNMSNKKYFKKVITPRMLEGVVNSAGTIVGNRVNKSYYIDCAYPSVPHYGVHLLYEFINPTTATVSYFLRIEATYYMSFKDVR